MKVRFLVDFRGKLTKEQFYLAGSEVEFPADVATRLVDEGRAEYVAEVAPEPPADDIDPYVETTYDEPPVTPEEDEASEPKPKGRGRR